MRYTKRRLSDSTARGYCEGYMDPAAHAARETQRARGRAPTRGELKAVAEVRKLLLSWPRSWANFSLLQLCSCQNAWANLHLLG
jgi:hypothetical protein